MGQASIEYFDWPTNKSGGFKPAHFGTWKTLVSPEEIETMLKDASKELMCDKPFLLKRLGIDEIALIKGQGKYCAVLVDLDQGKVIDIISDRTKDKITEVLTGWGTEV
jgi:transposase